MYTNFGILNYKIKDKFTTDIGTCSQSIRDYASGVAGAYESVQIIIPKNYLTLVGNDVYGLQFWINYLNRLKLPCKLESLASLKLSEIPGLATNYTISNINSKTAGSYCNTIEDDFYSVLIDFKEYKDNNLSKAEFLTLTLIRYIYSNHFHKLPGYTQMFKTMFPMLDRAQCLFLAHTGMLHCGTQHNSNSGNLAYNDYYGLVKGKVSYNNVWYDNKKYNFKILNLQKFKEKIQNLKSKDSWINNAMTVERTDGKDLYGMFNNGKFEELKEVAIQDARS